MRIGHGGRLRRLGQLRRFSELPRRSGERFDRGQQAVADFRQGLYETRLTRIVAETRAQQRDTARQHFVGSDPAAPDPRDELVVGHDLAGQLGQADQHVHDLWLEMQGAAGTRQGPEHRPDVHGPSLNPESSPVATAPPIGTEGYTEGKTSRNHQPSIRTRSRDRHTL